MEITGIILAGGKSSRMGEDKGLLELDGHPMIQHVINALKPIVSDIIIVSNQPEYEKFGFTVFEDEFKEKGPMAGIYTGLKNSSTKRNIVLSCDIPLIETAFLSWLLDQHKEQMITIPKVGNREHHLIGIYHRSIIGKYKLSISQNNLKLKIINDEIGCNLVEVDPEKFSVDLFTNINTKEDYLAL